MPDPSGRAAEGWLLMTVYRLCLVFLLCVSVLPLGRLVGPHWVGGCSLKFQTSQTSTREAPNHTEAEGGEERRHARVHTIARLSVCLRALSLTLSHCGGVGVGALVRRESVAPSAHAHQSPTSSGQAKAADTPTTPRNGTSQKRRGDTPTSGRAIVRIESESA